MKKSSSLIKKGRGFIVPESGKWITVTTFDGSGKYGYSNRYIPNTLENRSAIQSLYGKASDVSFYRGKKRKVYF